MLNDFELNDPFAALANKDSCLEEIGQPLRITC